MVAVNPRFTLLAFSLASLSLTPSANAAAIHTRPTEPGSPSKPARQLPMPMRSIKTAVKDKRSDDDMSKRGRVVEDVKTSGHAFSRRREAQAPFTVKSRVARSEDNTVQGRVSTPGHVDITSPNNSPEGLNNATTIGHLLLNTTSTPYVLDASEKNMTTLYMVPSDGNHITLELPLFDPAQNTTSRFCATFDPNPPAPEPLTMTPCFNSSNATTTHASQTFLYDQSSGVVQPMWFNGEDDGKTDETSASTASTVNDEEVADPDADADASETLTSRDSAQDVTLVFVPNTVAASEGDRQQDESEPATETDTVTKTVTASPTPSFAAADIDASSQSSTTTGISSQSTSFPSDRYLMSTTSSDSFTVTPSLTVADVSSASSSMTGVPSQSTLSTDTFFMSASSSDASATPSFTAAGLDAAPSSATDVFQSTTVSPSTSFMSASSSDASATSSFAAAGVDVASSSATDVSQSTAVSASTSATSSNVSTAAPSFSANIEPSSTDVPSQSTTVSASMSATSSDASSVGALEVPVAASPSSTDAMATTDTPSWSSYSSAPSATASTVDPAAAAADIATSSVSSFSESASAVPSPSSSASTADATVASPATDDNQAVYVGGSNADPAPRAEMTPVSTAPYQWMFRAEPRL
ncbi:hypothetical protein B0H17DRAFT_366665 [Mycena rosella]|uniref:Uncharacterized protein n=1 Tax=Mycena rosella TaxID=1033263 RepID=A0AAD7GZM3_MYCRO|nr:hypothetical protein B0H17DRAFT_366665 [Mycena rosella]